MARCWGLESYRVSATHQRVVVLAGLLATVSGRAVNARVCVWPAVGGSNRDTGAAATHPALGGRACECSAYPRWSCDALPAAFTLSLQPSYFQVVRKN